MFKKSTQTEILESFSVNFEKMDDNTVFMKDQFIEFDSDSKIKFNFKEWHIAICPNGGLIAACKKKDILDITRGSKINKNIIVTYQNLKTKYLIPIDWDYKKKYVINLEFNDKEQLYAICNDGSIFKIDITTEKAVPKPSSSLFENEPIVKAKLFENGFIALTLNGDFYFVKNIKNPEPQLFFAMKSLLDFTNDVDFVLIPSSLSKSQKLELLITNQKGEGLIHIEQNENGQFYFLPIDDSEVLECKGVSLMKKDKLEPYIKAEKIFQNEDITYSDETRLERIYAIAISPNKEYIAVYNEKGYVFLFKSNFDENEPRKRVKINLNEELSPEELLEQQTVINYDEGCQFLFCGEDAVALCGNRYIFVINSLGVTLSFKLVEDEKYDIEKKKIFFKCITEIDGLRCLTNQGIYFISQINNNLVQICDPLAISSAKKKLITAYTNSQNKITDSEKKIRSLKEKLSDNIYILQNAAMNIFWRKTDETPDKKDAQMILLNAAQHGKYYVKKEEFNFQKFYLNCKNIRVINNLRNNEKKPRLITYSEYENIETRDLIKYLVRALDFEMASKICQYLEQNIKYVYERYAISCIKRIKNYSKEDEERIFNLLNYKFENVPNFSFINISKKAFKYNKDSLAFKFLEKEKSILAKIPKYIDKKQWEKVLELCQNIYDTDVLKSIFENIFNKLKDNSDKLDIVKAAGNFLKLRSFLTEFFNKYVPECLDEYIELFKDPEEQFFYSLEQYFQSQNLSDRKKYLSMARAKQKLIDANINPNFEHKFYRNYIDSLEANLKYKLEMQQFLENPDNTSFDLSIYDTYKIGIKAKKYAVIKSKNNEFGFSQEGLSIVRFISLSEIKDFEGIDDIFKKNYTNIKKFNLTPLNMAEIFFKYKQYDKAAEVIKLIVDPIYFQYKIDMLNIMKKPEIALEVIISDKNATNMNPILRDIIKNDSELLKKAKEIAAKYKVALNL